MKFKKNVDDKEIVKREKRDSYENLKESYEKRFLRFAKSQV